MALTRIKAQQISDIDYKQAVRVITVSNVTLSGGTPTTVDGVTLVANDRILVAGQNTGSQNGIYYVSTLGTGSNGTWTRTSDANENGEIQAGMIVMVTEGTTYKDTQWKLTTNDPITIGSTTLTFEQNSAYAFGNIYANGTAVLASAVGGTVTFSAGNNIVITGNNTSKSVQFDVSNSISITGNLSATGNIVGNNISTTGQGLVVFNDSDNSNYVAFKANGTVSSNVVWTWPASDGTSGQVLATNGSGTLAWVTGGTGGSGLSWTTQANTAPAVAKPGDFWYDSYSDIKYQYINDGDGNVWVDQSFPTAFSSISVGGITNSNANAVGNIGSALTYFNTLFVSKINTNITVDASGNITAGNLSVNSGTLTVGNIVNNNSTGIGNIGSSTKYFNTVFAKATSAQYADLAEMYESDDNYSPGTVVVFGGPKEITISISSHDPSVAGIVSTSPSYLMNATMKGRYVLPVALTGRVPCMVQGPVKKGDVLVTAELAGTAQKISTAWQPGCVIGKSLEDIPDDAVRVIEVAVGRF